MLCKQEFYETEVWPRWLDEFKQSPSRTLFLPGIMGSELYDRNSNNTRWLDLGIFHEIDDLEHEDLTPNGSIDVDDQFIYARSIVDPPLSRWDPYTDFFDRIKPGRFNYDWRESIPIEAKRLRMFLRKIPENNDQINFVTHSMGGCILLWLLMSTDEFDKKIGKIIFCAPPFHGALKPIRVIEDGNGTPIDFLIRNRVLRRSAATMPGLFQLLVAPINEWVSDINLANEQTVKLEYPIRVTDSLYNARAWTNDDRLDIRQKILGFAEKYHRKKQQGIKSVVERLKDKICVVAGLNGKTTCAATRTNTGDWVLHKVPKPVDRNKISNGDGTVLFQSTVLRGLPETHYRAAIPKIQNNTHGDIMDQSNVIDDIESIINGKNPSKLVDYNTFIQKIDWTYEARNSQNPKLTDNLDYIERFRLRSVTPKQEWGPELNPRKDAEIFATSREAALRVLNGEDLNSEAARIQQNPEFLKGHIRTLLMPLLY